MKRIVRSGRKTAGWVGLFSILFKFLMAAGPVSAGQSVTLAWDANRESNLAGYVLHFGTSSLTRTNSINVGNVTSKTITGLVTGITYFFVVTAYNTSGLESTFSN